MEQQPRLTSSFGSPNPTHTSSTPSMQLRHTLGIAPNPNNIINKRSPPPTIDVNSGFHRVVNSMMPRVGTPKNQFLNQTYTQPPTNTIRESIAPNIMRESVTPQTNIIRESFFNNQPARTEPSFQVISEKVYRGQPTLQGQIPSPVQIVPVPNIQDEGTAYNLLKQDNRKLAQRLIEVSNERDQLEWELKNKNNIIFDYERRISLLARELENYGGHIQKSQKDYLTTQEIFDQNLSYLRNSYEQDRNGLLHQIQRLRDELTHALHFQQPNSSVQMPSDQSLLQKNQLLTRELIELQQRYDHLVDQIQQDLKNINNSDQSLTNLKKQNMDLRSQLATAIKTQNQLDNELARAHEEQSAIQRSLSPLKRSLGGPNQGKQDQRLAAENQELQSQLVEKDQIIQSLEADCRRFAELAKSNQGEQNWC